MVKYGLKIGYLNSSRLVQTKFPSFLNINLKTRIYIIKMTTSSTFQKVNDLFQCKLVLENGTEFVIPLREDGYIFATKLCQASEKKISHWLRSKETKELIKQIEKNDAHKRASALIEIYKGGNNKYSQGTWIHPDLGLNLAQWCSPNFALQVSRWLKELIFTGSVEIGKEKSHDDIIKQLQKQLKQAESLIIAYDEENKKVLKRYNKLYQTHQAYLKRKELYKLNKSSCVYLISMNRNKTDDTGKIDIKFGHTGDVTDRTSTYRTSNPYCKLLCVMYVQQNVTIETFLKIRYEKELQPNNSEFVSGIPVEILINDLKEIAESLRVPYSFETQEELDKFNRNVIPISEVEENKEELEEEIGEIIEYDSTTTRRCGGVHHETEESRMLTVDNFFKNASNRDGLARLCKECYLIGQYGDKRKRRKVVVIPKHDVLVDKWCNRCESVKSRDLFYKDTSTKDGISANCKVCKLDQKKEYKKKLKEKKANTVENTIENTVENIEDTVENIEDTVENEIYNSEDNIFDNDNYYEEIIVDSTILKRCGSSLHTDVKSRYLTLDKFLKM